MGLLNAKLIIPNITPEFLVARYPGLALEFAAKLISRAEYIAYTGNYFQEFKDSEGIAFLVWDIRTNSATLEIW